MEISAIAALMAATALLVSIPGPNVALFVANTLAHGTRHGALTVFGTTIGVGIQLGIVVLGFAILLELAAGALTWLRWAGVAYLIYLGIRAWRQGATEVEELSSDPALLRGVFWQGMFLAVINPKTLIFAAAFLPQFVPHAGEGSFVLLLPALIYLGVIFAGDMLWVATAHIAKPAILRLGRLRHRLTGCLFVGSGIGLALARARE